MCAPKGADFVGANRDEVALPKAAEFFGGDIPKFIKNPG